MPYQEKVSQQEHTNKEGELGSKIDQDFSRKDGLSIIQLFYDSLQNIYKKNVSPYTLKPDNYRAMESLLGKIKNGDFTNTVNTVNTVNTDILREYLIRNSFDLTDGLGYEAVYKSVKELISTLIN